MVKRHPEYAKAKSGDIGAARALVAELVSQDRLEAVKSLLRRGPGQHGLPTLVKPAFPESCNQGASMS